MIYILLVAAIAWISTMLQKDIHLPSYLIGQCLKANVLTS